MKRRQSAMVTYSPYPADPRVRREAEALVEAGMSVDVICITDGSGSRKENVNGVNVYRLPFSRRRAGKLRYACEYGCFLFTSFFMLSCLYIRKRYNVVHVHNMPDVLVFCALLPRLCGAKVILDLHDPSPEIFMAKYDVDNKNFVVRLLCLAEKLSIWFAHLVLTPNLSFKRLFVSRGCPQAKIHVIMNSPLESIFRGPGNGNRGRSTDGQKKFAIMYHGMITERNGVDLAIRAINAVRREIPDVTFELYGAGDFVDRCLSLITELGLDDAVTFHGGVPLETIAEVIESVDVGLVSNRPSVHWEHAMPTRIFEYLSMGKPVIAPRTGGILDYFGTDDLYFFESGNTQNIVEAIMDVYRNRAQRLEKIEHGMAVYKRHCWQIQRHRLQELVRALTDTPVHVTAKQPELE
ncbi:MAG: glycosyltransferase family 4 protein [Planctomycetota bacterium]